MSLNHGENNLGQFCVGSTMRTRNQNKNMRFDSSYRIENILLCYCDVKFKILDSQAAITVLDHHIMIIALATAHI